MVKTLAYIENLEVRQSKGNFLKCLNESARKIITPRDEAYVRLQTRGRENIGIRYGTWTSAGFEYVREQLPILRLESRLLDLKLARQAFEANKRGKYFNTESTKEYEDSLKQAEKDKNKRPSERKVIILPSRDDFTIKEKENWEVLETILKDQAKPYFELNGPIPLYFVDEETVDSQNGTLLTQLWFRYLVNRSGFDGYYWYLDYNVRAHWVFEKTSEAGRA
ncbi:MAG: hypothetical protein AABX77_01115 [Nanoarchaeota archaeon]